MINVMGNSKNKHGLSRHIDAEIARQLRQEAGFGCVVCGCSLITYEHIINFSDVDQHRAEDMAVLCENCHGKVTRGQLSKEYVRGKKANPKALEDGFARDVFFTCSEQPTVILGDTEIKDVETHLMIGHDPIIWIKAPDDEGGQVRLNLALSNKSGSRILEIVDNEWRVNKANWDVETTANRMRFRKSKGNISLEIEFQAPDKFKITRMNMLHKGFSIFLDRSGLQLRYGSFWNVSLSGNLIQRCKVGIRIE